jgi:two-component system sensor histidine kinase PilS (NtrC family)
MVTNFNESTWLAWLAKVRIIIITFILGIGLAIVRLTPTNIESRLLVGVIALWYTIAVFYLLLNYLWDEPKLMARMQVFTDLVFATGIVYVTGGIDTSFNFLYPLVIIVASILLPRWWAYLTAAFAFIAFGAILELSYFEIIRSYSVTRPDLKSLQAVIIINLFAYIAIAYLSSNLSMKLRQVDVQLQDKSGALENLQAQHENIIHSVRSGLITTGLDGRISLLNVPGQKLLERKAQDVYGKRVEEIFQDALPIADSQAVTGEVRALTPEGEEKTFGITVTSLKNSDRSVIGYVYTFDDQTEVRRLEREVRMRDRLTAVGRMAAGIAHEIRNPLASIAGSVQVLRGISNLSEEQKTLVGIVVRESERLNAIISDFLVYSREKTLQFRNSDVVALLNDTLTLLENHPQQGTAPVEIVREFRATDAMASIDGDRMKQVFWNLAENALKAMPNGGKLVVGLRRESADLLISFKDNGRGMSQPEMDKIFEPFQSSFSGGTGLGLAIVYQILQAHDAKINAYSAQGRGSEFVIRIKAADARPQPVLVKSSAGGARG